MCEWLYCVLCVLYCEVLWEKKKSQFQNIIFSVNSHTYLWFSYSINSQWSQTTKYAIKRPSSLIKVDWELLKTLLKIKKWQFRSWNFFQPPPAVGYPLLLGSLKYLEGTQWTKLNFDKQISAKRFWVFFESMGQKIGIDGDNVQKSDVSGAEKWCHRVR